MQQFAVSRCFRFPVMPVSLIHCESTLLLSAGCNLGTVCIAHISGLSSSLLPACVVVKIHPGVSTSTRADSRNRFL